MHNELMDIEKDFRDSIIRKYITNRLFELSVVQGLKDKLIKGPIYLSIGQDHIPAVLATYLKNYALFPQHRCHSYLLSFGADIEKVAREICGLDGALNGGMGGSASLGDPDKKIFGHSGLLGDQVPIAVGYAYGTKQKTLCIIGDAAAEEDYVLGAIGQAATLDVPIVFVVEDNNLSILTEKKVRRSWDIVEVARGFQIPVVFNSNDNILTLSNMLKTIPTYDSPCLININTHRHLWHAGYGVDSPPPYDHFTKVIRLCQNDNFYQSMYWEIQDKMDMIWKKIFEELKDKNESI